MKKVIRNMSLIVAFGLIAFLGLLAFIRLAPSDPAVWHIDPSAAYTWPQGQQWDEVVPLKGRAVLRLSPEKGAPGELLARLDAVAVATPSTQILTGSVAEGRITWITRSALWGFPDYTTAEARDDGLYVYGRLRFGRADGGVNARRLTDWLARL